MRSTPNYFKFRQWLGDTMKITDPLKYDHFHANDVYQDNLLDETEIIPVALVLSCGALMLEDARKYFQKHAYSSKTPVFQCGLNAIENLENYDPYYFEHDNSIPDFFTLGKLVAWFDGKNRNAQIFFHVAQAEEVWDWRLLQGYKFISMRAPAWFSCQYNMVYSKMYTKMHYSEPEPLTRGEIWHDLVFYHSNATDFFPFELNTWINPSYNNEND